MRKSIRSFRYAWAGIRTLFYSENNAKVHFFASAVVIIAGLWLGLRRSDWLDLFAAMTFVWTAEAFNTALERVVNLVSPGYHTLAKEAKDLAAGAVLISSIFAVIVGVLVFQKYVPWQEWAATWFGYQLPSIYDEFE